MKNRKNYFAIAGVAMVTALSCLSCIPEEEGYNKPNIYQNRCIYIDDASSIRTITPFSTDPCSLPERKCELGLQRSAPYRFFVHGKETYARWIINSGSGLTFKNGATTVNGSVVTVYFAKNFKEGTIKAFGNDPQGGNYAIVLTIRKK
ncbi:hypothetical protein NAT51_07920 [Flavobacterium amniphilum]|uniref:hypothetical protein n=1 Tax=Flavobacterium amniphilum TaxID=1834035 RepID=UPI00202A8208|nr:hypothetical protein [Flavobacterium amniphilum]MCL9805444.1 hypothetical protein [Flavobacterium amniphilum]